RLTMLSSVLLGAVACSAAGDEPAPDAMTSDGADVPSDWLSGWAYRRPLVITNAQNAALADQQVFLDFDTYARIQAGKMRADGGDIRIADADGHTLLPYWIESPPGDGVTRIWFKSPTIPADGQWAYVYYGNPAAESAASGEATFELFDDFNGTALDGSR